MSLETLLRSWQKIGDMCAGCLSRSCFPSRSHTSMLGQPQAQLWTWFEASLHGSHTHALAFARTRRQTDRHRHGNNITTNKQKTTTINNTTTNKQTQKQTQTNKNKHKQIDIYILHIYLFIWLFTRLLMNVVTYWFIWLRASHARGRPPRGIAKPKRIGSRWLLSSCCVVISNVPGNLSKLQFAGFSWSFVAVGRCLKGCWCTSIPSSSIFAPRQAAY